MESIMIKDATKKLGIEAHVLRYWEEELGLEIKRNSMGHRYYDEKDIRMFGEIKRLRDEGISLKEIRTSIERRKKKMQRTPGQRKQMQRIHIKKMQIQRMQIQRKQIHRI